jgi:hypothetical protein
MPGQTWRDTSHTGLQGMPHSHERTARCPTTTGHIRCHLRSSRGVSHREGAQHATTLPPRNALYLLPATKLSPPRYGSSQYPRPNSCGDRGIRPSPPPPLYAALHTCGCSAASDETAALKHRLIVLLYNTNVLLLSTVLASTCSTYRQAVRRMTISLAQFIVHERTVLEGTNEQFC